MRFLGVPTTTGARNHGETAVKSQDHWDGPGLSFPAIGFMIFSRAGWRRGASRAHPAPGVRALDLSGLVLDTTNFATGPAPAT